MHSTYHDHSPSVDCDKVGIKALVDKSYRYIMWFIMEVFS